MTCAEVEDEHSAYVWGGLEAGERWRIDAHRAGCAGCEQRLVASEAVIAELDQAHPRLAPPPELRGRVLGAIARLEQAPDTLRIGDLASLGRPAPQSVRPGTELSEAAASDRYVGRSHRPPGEGRPSDAPAWSGAARRDQGVLHPRAFWYGLATGVAGVAAAAALVLVFMVRPEALGLIGGRQTQFGSSEPSPAGPAITLPWQAPKSASSGRLLELRSTSGSGRGLLAFDTSSGHGVLMVEGVSTSDGGEYGVWLAQGTQRVQVGTLSVDSRGFGSFVLPDPLPVERPERIEVSGPTPTGGGDSASMLSAFF